MICGVHYYPEWSSRGMRSAQWFGRHTMIDIEIWEKGERVGANGAECWLCEVAW